MTETKSNNQNGEEQINAAPLCRSWGYRREQEQKRHKRLYRIVTSSYVPHAGYVDWSEVNGCWRPTGKYIKYPKNSNCQRWIKRETGKRMRNCKDMPIKGNYYRRLFDYWRMLY